MERSAREALEVATRSVQLERLCDDRGDACREAVGDAVAREEPLELRIGGAPLAVVMRTPGHDAERALGFLVSERVVARARDVVSIRPAPCPDLPRGCAAAYFPEANPLVPVDGVAVGSHTPTFKHLEVSIRRSDPG